MDGLFEVLGSVVAALDAAGIPHMVSGSVASARHGEARATQDIDIVIDPDLSQVVDLVAVLRDAGMYVTDGRVALEERSQFNVIDTASGWKVDLIIRKDRPYSRAEFDRRRSVSIGGVQTAIVTAEDSILSKLEWASLGGSERQLADARSIAVAQSGDLDWAYLERWAIELDVRSELDVIRAESGHE
jgi:hypothetical protein